MPSSAASAPYTWDDFVALDEDDLRELIDGELLEVEVPTDTHEHIVTRIGSALTVWADAGHGGRALGSGYKVRISDRRGLMPAGAAPGMTRSRTATWALSALLALLFVVTGSSKLAAILRRDLLARLLGRRTEAP